MNKIHFVIRDAIEADIHACIALDHSYQTEYVWRMAMLPDNQSWQVNFTHERLPRAITLNHPADENRLRLALPAHTCYLVAATKDDPELMLGYLTMRPDPIREIALVQDIVVGVPFRRQGVASRLLAVARRWASEHQMRQLMVETQTKNLPAITFLQQQGLHFCGFNDQYFRNQDIAVFFGQKLR